MLKINFSRQAKKFLRVKRPAKINLQIGAQLNELRTNPNPNPHDSSHLSGFSFKRVDVGEYRIVYFVKDDTLKILVIGKRNDNEVYKALKRGFC